MFDSVERRLDLLINRFEEFTQTIRRIGLEYFGRYYAPQRGIVTSNSDPAGQGRIEVKIPAVNLKEKSNKWLWPMMSGAGTGHGEFFPPEPGDGVWVFFENGDPDHPMCYLGGWYSGKDLDSTLSPDADKPPKKRGWVSPGGSKIILDDDKETILIRQKSGIIVKIEKDVISVGKEDGKFEPMMRGDTVKKWLLDHKHPHAYGPTAPTDTPWPSDGLSKESKTS